MISAFALTLATGFVHPVLATEGGQGETPVIVAVDPGHGGTNLGASGAAKGVYEKDVTLAIARRLQARLASSPQVRVVLCRDRDVLIPIRARARCARDAGAALFVSLHTNAVPATKARGQAQGFDVFVLGPADVADDAAVDTLGIDDPLERAWRAHRLATAAGMALSAAKVIRAQLGKVWGVAADRGIRQEGALLDVLRGTGVASVLVELGFLDHPRDGTFLASDAGQEALAGALAAALVEITTPWSSATDRGLMASGSHQDRGAGP